jgi:superfamily I DNA and RNA helicase
MMPTSYFFLQAEKNERNSKFLSAIEKYAEEKSQQIYVVDRPLADSKYIYGYSDKLIVLTPGFQIILLNYGDNNDQFSEFVDDFIEDLASISDKFRYKNIIGRSRYWKDKLIAESSWSLEHLDINGFLSGFSISDAKDRKSAELLISLLTGSINDIDQVKSDVPDNILDKVKQKIILFDGDQTRFIYQRPDKKIITIQGLSGTGKTELLLHKLKDIYVANKKTKIIFTCHNKILADSLRNRIPDFFNFMKVEEQIRWNKRLWCVNAWGSQGNSDSGAYSYICSFYNIPFYRYSYTRNFDDVCKIALEHLSDRNIAEIGYAFDYMLVDESQDFPASFFELCSKVTKTNVYIAGDIFQSIFDSAVISEIKPDYLLSKCYRTDPRTLMFAHAIGMGLFETPKLRWLEEKEWKACGYIVHKEQKGKVFRLTREPLRRFEDLAEEGVNSVEIVKTRRDKDEDAEIKIIEIIRSIIDKYPSATPNDIGVIFIDNTKNTYLSADRLEQSIPREFGWIVNKAYESKESRAGELFVSNRNNVKGLEFPFVICVTKKINDSRNYRNSLYMMLTRSFIRSYLLTSLDSNEGLIDQLESGLHKINSEGTLTVVVPSEQEKKQIKTTIEYKESSISYYDFVHSIFDDLDIPIEIRNKLYTAVKSIVGDDFDYDNVREVVEFSYKKMCR